MYNNFKSDRNITVCNRDKDPRLNRNLTRPENNVTSTSTSGESNQPPQADESQQQSVFQIAVKAEKLLQEILSTSRTRSDSGPNATTSLSDISIKQEPPENVTTPSPPQTINVVNQNNNTNGLRLPIQQQQQAALTPNSAQIINANQYLAYYPTNQQPPPLPLPPTTTYFPILTQPQNFLVTPAGYYVNQAALNPAQSFYYNQPNIHPHLVFPQQHQQPLTALYYPQSGYYHPHTLPGHHFNGYQVHMNTNSLNKQQFSPFQHQNNYRHNGHSQENGVYFRKRRFEDVNNGGDRMLPKRFNNHHNNSINNSNSNNNDSNSLNNQQQSQTQFRPSSSTSIASLGIFFS